MRRATIARPFGRANESISIHALRAEGDTNRQRSARDADISIHALRAEGDFSAVAQASSVKYFYPRPPCGGRLIDKAMLVPRYKFLSTPSVRRATPRYQAIFYVTYYISIHALRAEGDGPCPPEQQRRVKFLSTPSVRRATRPFVRCQS